MAFANTCTSKMDGPCPTFFPKYINVTSNVMKRYLQESKSCIYILKEGGSRKWQVFVLLFCFLCFPLDGRVYIKKHYKNINVVQKISCIRQLRMSTSDLYHEIQGTLPNTLFMFPSSQINKWTFIALQSFFYYFGILLIISLGLQPVFNSSFLQVGLKIHDYTTDFKAQTPNCYIHHLVNIQSVARVLSLKFG